jgi:hypothetical protein
MSYFTLRSALYMVLRRDNSAVNKVNYVCKNPSHEIFIVTLLFCRKILWVT